MPLKSYFNIGDPVTYLGNIYLFSDIGYGVDNTRGALLVLDNYTGNILNRDNNALYNNIKTANYGLPYYNTVGIIKNNELDSVECKGIISVVISIRNNK